MPSSRRLSASAVVILSQVAGHGLNVVKFIPPLTLGDDDRQWVVNACDQVIADCHKVPGSIWDLGKTLAAQAIKIRKGKSGS